MRNVFALAVLAISLVSTFECSAQEKAPKKKQHKPAHTAMAAPAGELNLTDKDNGKSVAVATGQVLRLKLRENPTTGYVWLITDSAAGKIMTVNSTYAEDPHKAGMTGVGGTHQWQFKVAGKGSLNLALLHTRPWEKDSKGAETFKITLKAK